MKKKHPYASMSPTEQWADRARVRALFAHKPTVRASEEPSEALASPLGKMGSGYWW